jgi:flagellar biosynthetic protein FliR
MPDTLIPILPHLPLFLLALFRLAGIFVFGPMLNSSSIPMRIRALLAVVLTFCIYPMIPPQASVNLSVATIALSIAGEMLIGMVIGFGASLPLTAMQLGGVMMGQQLGLGLARVFNPDFDEDVDTLGQVLYIVALTIFIMLDGHHAMLSALVHSFRNVPVGVFAPSETLVMMTTGLLASTFELAVRVSAPLLCLVFLETIAMGFLSKTVPQLNVMNHGFPIRIVVGFALIAAAMAAMSDALITAIRQALVAVFNVFG